MTVHNNQNNEESVDFTLDKVYSGIDLCMKLGYSYSVYRHPLHADSLPTHPPNTLTSISMFVLVVSIYFMFHEWYHYAIHCASGGENTLSVVKSSKHEQYVKSLLK